jgi:hypothetical protein
LNEPFLIAGRQLAGFFEDFGGGTAHGEIVARVRLKNYASRS